MKQLNVHVELTDGQVLDTRARTSDYVKFEIEGKKRGWGSVGDNPSTWEAYISYAALIRERLISMPFEKFLEQAEIVDATPVVDDETFEEKEVTGLPKSRTDG